MKAKRARGEWGFSHAALFCPPPPDLGGVFLILANPVDYTRDDHNAPRWTMALADKPQIRFKATRNLAGLTRLLAEPLALSLCR